ncbi:hypothetical protein GJU43_20880 [Flavobacterium sp. LC2016-23]|uniref:hypothetical protein n=1 Tax=Flavobacterium sp. LC2016-23 TaxID=2666330 RepID=UPI0012B0CD3F|nr:hypothetical protein [Flavobacterium sp. LC2016-23]MRX41744.1 hypothetical protein [Flavobacterium sp. LC2016-23]
MKPTLKKTARIVLISFALILWSCENDSSSSGTQIPQDTSIESAKKWFDAYEDKGENIVLMQNLDYNWNDAQLTKSEDGTETIIVPINELKKDQGDLWEQKLYIYKSDEGRYSSLLFEAYSNKNIKPESQSVDGGDFTGYITVWDLKKGFVRGAKFLNNQVVEEGVAEFAIDRNKTNRAPETGECIFSDLDDGCHNDGGDGAAIPLREVIVKGSSKGTPVIYTPRGPVIGGTTPGGYTSPGGGGGNSGGGGITAPTPVKITDALIGKAKCLNDLLNKSGDSFVQKLLANFQGKSEFDILIVSKDKVTSSKDGVITEINGRTLPPVNKVINIEISISKSNTNSSLDVARTILHEYIHADIFRKLSTKLGTDKERLDFKTTYEAYGEQHSTIAALYLNSMKEALKKFHQSVLTDDYNKYTQYYGEAPSDAFYEALAWGGLQDANVKAWTDLPEDKKAAIKALANRVPMLSKAAPCTN